MIHEFLICTSRDDGSIEVILHTQFPRFLARATEQPLSDALSVSADDVEWLCIVGWLDPQPPEADVPGILKEAVAEFSIYKDEIVDS